MKKYRYTLSIGFPGAEHEETVELPDDVTEEEVNADYQRWVWEHIDGGPTLEGES